MALLADRVKETTTTTGTGTVSLAGAPAGFQSFNTAFANGSLVYYVIQGGAEWEIGIGTTGTGTLARTQVLQSSNADALVPFSAGVKDVFCSYVADRAVTTVDAATLTNKTIDDYTNDIGANSTHFRIKATGTISKGSVVKATGYNPGEQAIEVAVVSSATDLVLGISEQALTTGQFGLAVVIGELFDVNTNGFTVGNIIYSNGAGGFTETKPTSGLYQALGWIVRANTSNGVIAVNVVAPLYVETATNTANTSVLRDGSGNFAAGTITATLSGTATQVSNALTAGTYLTSGGTYNGSAARTFAVDATDANTASKVVARDASGNFAAGTITAALAGNATTATTADKVANALTAGTYLTSAGTFDGSAARTFAVDATDANTASKVVARDGSGNFSAGTITANLSGTATQVSQALTAGSYLTSTGTYNGGTARTFAVDATDANTASKVVARDASGNFSAGTITATLNGAAPAGSLSGNTLASGVTASSLTSVGTLSSLTVSGGIRTNQFAEIRSDTASLYWENAANNRYYATALSGTASSPSLTTSYFDGTNVLSRLSLDASGNLAVDTNTLYVDAANNRVGVGTASPLAPFHVAQSSSAILFSQDSTTATIVGTNAAGNASQGLFLRGFPLTFTGNGGGGAEHMRLDASGNLGLGVTPSAWGTTAKALQVDSRTAIWQQSNVSVFSNNVYAATGGNTYIATAAATQYYQDAGAHVWRTAPSGTAGNAISFTQDMTLSGKALRVGVTADLGGFAFQAPNQNGFIVHNSASSAVAASFCAGSSISLASAGNLAVVNGVDGILFGTGGTGGTERARITSGGYFKASDAGTYNGATSAYHELRNSANAPSLVITNSNASLADDIIFGNTAIAAGTGFNMLRFSANGVQQFYVRGDGNVYNTNGTYGTISDAAIKQDIVDASSQWADLKAIQFRKYRLKDQVAQDANAPYLLGVVAQELEQVSPGLVDENRDGIKAVKQSVLLMKAAVALQEAMARIETLEQRVLALEA